MQKKQHIFPSFFIAAISTLAFISPSNAQLDPLIEGAKLCTKHLQHYEREYGIPSHLLSAIASTESGRYHDDLKIKLPWPWTINADGKGYFLNSKEEAISTVYRLRASGIKSIDVGCMQVNLYHHPNAFSSLSQAFDPANNVAYAAKFLRDLYQEEGSWKQAASDYHSKTPDLGNKYVGIVYNSWFKIVDKLRTARLNVPNSSIDGLQEMQNAGVKTGSTPKTIEPKHIIVADKNNNYFQDIKQKSPSQQIKSIKVTTQGTAEQGNTYKKLDNGIIVVRPEISINNAHSQLNTQLPEKSRPPEPMIIADANSTSPKSNLADLLPSSGSEPPQTGSSISHEAKIIRLDNKLVDRRTANVGIDKKSGPSFIFDN